MHELDPWKVAIFMGGIATGLMAFIGKRYMNKVDDIEAKVARQDGLEERIRTSINSLIASFDALRDTQERYHRDNTSRLDSVIFQLTRGDR